MDLTMILAILFSAPTVFLVSFILYRYLKSIRLLADYSTHSFKSITGLKFMKYSKLPKERDFFKNHLHINNGLFNTTLPKIDLNDYNFEDVHISSCNFTRDTILPKDVDFFQKIKNKQLIDCKLPSGDYSSYNFNGVTLNRVEFPKDAILPQNPSFFRLLDNRCFVQVTLPDSFNETCHLYDLSKTELCLPSKISVSNIQKCIIMNKNNGHLYSFIKIKKNYINLAKNYINKIIFNFKKSN